MSFVRDLWTDLVDKRLWPVAAALVLALVAIPVLLLEPAASPSPAPAPVADTGPAHLVSDPSAIAAARPRGAVVGEAKNPFDQKHVPKKPETTSSSPSAGPGTTDSTSGSGGSAPSSSGDGGPGSGGSTQKPASKPAEGVTRLKVRFGPTEGKRRVRVLTPGAPLPSTTAPVLVFVEVGRGSRAEFLVSSDAVPQGDGRCKPSKSVCAQLFVSPGDTQFFDVTTNRGVVQYQLDVLDVLK